jgi:hypothetical protein
MCRFIIIPVRKSIWRFCFKVCGLSYKAGPRYMSAVGRLVFRHPLNRFLQKFLALDGAGEYFWRRVGKWRIIFGEILSRLEHLSVPAQYLRSFWWLLSAHYISAPGQLAGWPATSSMLSYDNVILRCCWFLVTKEPSITSEDDRWMWNIGGMVVGNGKGNTRRWTRLCHFNCL